MSTIVPISQHLGAAHDIAPEALDVAKVLTEDIIFGRLEPGARLVEDALITRFGASRHFIRQALQELIRTGVAVRERNKSVKVRSLTPAEVRQIYDVRELLQRHAVLLIPLPAGEGLVQRLEALNDTYGRCLQARDWSGVHAANDAFHLTLFGACGNAYLVESIKHYMQLTLPVRAKKTASVEHAEASARDHHVMVQLLKGADRWSLAQLCVDHLQGPKNAYLKSVEGASSPSADSAGH